jgi:hypothetical protein
MEMKYHKVKDHPNLLRDPHSGAVVMNDFAEYQKAKARQVKEQIFENRISKLENEVGEMNKKLSQLLEILTNND